MGYHKSITNHEGFLQSCAYFSNDEKYRFILTRKWNKANKVVVFIGLNPSKATEMISDPTVRRCVNYAKQWGYDEMIMLNIFALRSTNPKQLYKSKDPIGDMNDFCIREDIEMADLIVASWGNHGEHLGRGMEVYKIIKEMNVKCFGINQSGQPVHPLYQRNDAELIDFKMEE